MKLTQLKESSGITEHDLEVFKQWLENSVVNHKFTTAKLAVVNDIVSITNVFGINEVESDHDMITFMIGGSQSLPFPLVLDTSDITNIVLDGRRGDVDSESLSKNLPKKVDRLAILETTISNVEIECKSLSCSSTKFDNCKIFLKTTSQRPFSNFSNSTKPDDGFQECVYLISDNDHSYTLNDYGVKQYGLILPNLSLYKHTFHIELAIHMFVTDMKTHKVKIINTLHRLLNFFTKNPAVVFQLPATLPANMSSNNIVKAHDALSNFIELCDASRNKTMSSNDIKYELDGLIQSLED